MDTSHSPVGEFVLTQIPLQLLSHKPTSLFPNPFHSACTMAASTTTASTVSPPSSMQVSIFPVQMHYALEDMERNGQSHIASWRPHGRCFQVHDREAFTTTILPRWFNMTKFSSFQRQLNIYSFKRIRSGRDDGSFYHENFLRGAPDLAREIKRVPIKLHAAVVSAKKTVTAAPMRAPNFDQQPPLPATKRAVVGAVGAGAIVGSASGTDSTAVSAAASSSIVADGLAALATSGPLGAVAFAGQDQRRNEFFASIQSNIVPSRSSDAPLVLAYFEHNEHELNLLKCRQLLLRLQMKQQIERQSLLAAVSRFRQQQNSNFLLRQLVQFQGQNESGR